MFTQARELRNMRLSPDPQIFYVPDLIPAVGKIQNACQRKHIVIHVLVTILWSDVRATCARVLGEEGVNAHCHTLRPSSKPGDCTWATMAQYPSHYYHRALRGNRLCSRPITHAWEGGVSLSKTDTFLHKMCVTKADYDENGKNICREKFDS